MKVILLEDVKGVGKKDQIIEAAEGHAKNFLLPRKLAVEATKANINELETKRKNIEIKRQKELEEANQLKAELETKIIKIEVKTGENGKIFGSVTNKEIAEAFERQTGVKIDKKKIVLAEPIKVKGARQVELRLHSSVTAKLNIEIE